MSDRPDVQQAVDLLQELGLKEYEARSFVSLSRTPQASAKEISEFSGVPRTRVYDAVQVLEDMGLVESQMGTPKQFRAVSIAEAAETLRHGYHARIEDLKETLTKLGSLCTEEDDSATNEVWALGGAVAIANRTRRLVADATEEINLVVGDGTVVSTGLIDRLRTARHRGVRLVIGVTSDELRDQFRSELPGVSVNVFGSRGVLGADSVGDETTIGRIVLIDRETVLISSLIDASDDGQLGEWAVVGRGVDNGMVALTRRMLSAGLLPVEELVE